MVRPLAPAGARRPGSDEARREEALVRDHLHLVRMHVAEVANRVPRHFFRDDLTSAAMAALALAARAFDPSRNVSFDHYASTRIRGALIDELRAHDWASRSLRSRARHLTSAVDGLVVELGREPTRPEVAARSGMTVEAVEAIEQDLQRAAVYNYDAMVLEGAGEELLPVDEASPEVVLVDRERKAYLVDGVAALPDRLRAVVVGYFFEGRSMRELARSLGVTESRICQMRTEALGWIRDGMNALLEDPGPEAHDAPARSTKTRRREAYVTAMRTRSDFTARLSYRDTVQGGRAELSRSSRSRAATR